MERTNQQKVGGLGNRETYRTTFATKDRNTADTTRDKFRAAQSPPLRNKNGTKPNTPATPTNTTRKDHTATTSTAHRTTDKND